MNTVGHFEIQSSNPLREIKFYHAIFNWEFIRQEQLPIEYYRIETKGISGGLLIRSANIPASESGTNAFVCSIEVENFERKNELIIQHGGHVTLPKFAVPGRCWQGYFVDQDNNVFGIFEVDENAA